MVKWLNNGDISGFSLFKKIYVQKNKGLLENLSSYTNHFSIPSILICRAKGRKAPLLLYIILLPVIFLPA